MLVEVGVLRLLFKKASAPILMIAEHIFEVTQVAGHHTHISLAFLSRNLMHLALAQQLSVLDELSAQLGGQVAVPQRLTMLILLGHDGAQLQVQFTLVA